MGSRHVHEIIEGQEIRVGIGWKDRTGFQCFKREIKTIEIGGYFFSLEDLDVIRSTTGPPNISRWEFRGNTYHVERHYHSRMGLETVHIFVNDLDSHGKWRQTHMSRFYWKGILFSILLLVLLVLSTTILVLLGQFSTAWFSPTLFGVLFLSLRILIPNTYNLYHLDDFLVRLDISFFTSHPF